jgi:hypothetical protein
MVRIISTDGVAVVVHDGKEYRPDRKGVFEVPDAIVAALLPHGFKRADESQRAG